MKFEELEFLRESNNIEDVWDDRALEQAILAWKYIKYCAKIDATDLLKMHKILMLHQPLKPDEKGYFRKVPVWIGGREGLHHAQVPGAIEAWCTQVNAHVSIGDPSWKIDHIHYEEIHPFIDGNGRTGRILLNWQRYRVGLPILTIKESEKKDYYQWFSNV